MPAGGNFKDDGWSWQTGVSHSDPSALQESESHRTGRVGGEFFAQGGGFSEKLIAEPFAEHRFVGG